MKIIFCLQFFLYYLYSSATESTRQALFSVISNYVYVPQFSSSFIINLSNNSMASTSKCAIQCLNYDRCQTAVYYENKQVCSLFYEKSSMGQIIPTINEISSVLVIEDRQPLSCIVSSQSTWLSNATIIIGNSNGTAGSDLSTLKYPSGIYYDLTRNDLLVSDRDNYRVIKFSLDNPSADGIILVGGNGQGCSLNQLGTITGLVLNSVRQLYVIDSNCQRVVKFPADSNSTIYGELIGTMNMPTGITVDHQTDDIYVADSGNSFVKKFANGSTVGVIVVGGRGWGSGLNQVTSMYSIYFDDIYTNALYVSDYSNSRVLKFPTNSTNGTFGTMVAGDGSTGDALTQLSYSMGVTIDMHGLVYVSDGVGRVQRWLPNATMGEVVVGGLFGTPEYAYFTQILFDINFNLVALETYQHRIRLYNLNSC